MGERKIVQTCAVVRDLQKSMERYWEVLGIGPWDVHTFNQDTLTEYTVQGKPVNEPFEFVLAVTMVGDVQFELVQPVKGPNIYEAFLNEKGEGYHHVKEIVDDDKMEETLEAYREKGIEVIQSGRYDGDVFYYLDTEPTLGIVYELGNCGQVRAPERRYPPDAETPKSRT